MTQIKVKSITAADTYDLRHRILRPHQTPRDCRYPSDHQEIAGHFGAYIADDLKGIGSVFCEREDGSTGGSEWRIRGMAVLSELHGQGVGALIVQAMIKHVRDHDGKRVWCNARTPACGFYEKLGFAKLGKEFDIAGIGPHFVMETVLIDG